MTRLTPLEKGVIFLNSRVQTITVNFMIPESLGWSALCQYNDGGDSIDSKLKGHKHIEESSPHDEFLDNLDEEKCKGNTSKT